jgi:hypothetical protein
MKDVTMSTMYSKEPKEPIFPKEEEESLFTLVGIHEKLEKKLEMLEKKKELGGIHVCTEWKIGTDKSKISTDKRKCHFIAATKQVLANHIQFWHKKRQGRMQKSIEESGIFECDNCGQIFSTLTSHKVNLI